MIVCAGNSEQFDFALPIGVGLIDSAINLTRLCLFDPPKFLLFIGTAGSYGNKKIYDVIESKTACNIENSFFQNKSYTPIDNVVSANSEIVSHETLINSSNYITTDKEISKEYLKRNIQAENMEFYSVLKVAKEFNIPAGGLFVITNYCDKFAHEEFMKNQKTAMKIVENELKIRGQI